jgi:hypothetical protein
MVEIIQEIRRAEEEIRNEIRRTKLMIIIGFTLLITIHILLMTDMVLTVRAICFLTLRKVIEGLSCAQKRLSAMKGC